MVILLIALLLAIPSVVTKAQTNGNNSGIAVTLNKVAEQNFLNGLNSVNTGLRKSCIYFAGKYKISSAVIPLMAQLRKEKDTDTKILIALALYEIGDARGMYLVKVVSDNDDNSKVRKRCTAIYDKYVQDRTSLYATL
jgi:HEAT repeat protein